MTQSRRHFLQHTVGLAAGLYVGSSNVSARAAASPNEKLNIGLIGIGGRGSANLGGVSSQNIVALCDVDDKRAGGGYSKFPKAKRFHDFRKMLDTMENDLDAVVVSTPDHTHFHPSMMAMEMGKHLYCEKPMAHTVQEVRLMTEKAVEKKVATQLGVQRHTIPNVHRVVELVQAGAIGKVTEVHAWVGGERGMPKVPTDKPDVPDHLKWDLWLGPAADRSYHAAYCPYNWRFWWDFGTGETGNWGCHILDIPFWALKLKYPTHVSGDGPKPHPQTTPKQLASHFTFPAEGDRGEVKLHWYHAKNGPDVLREHKLPSRGNNTLFIGTEGMLLCGFSQRRLYPEAKFAGFATPQASIPNSPGFYKEWFTACKGGKAATCDFEYSGPLTETVLLGNVAYRAGGGFDWDAKQVQAVGSKSAQQWIDLSHRKGWELG